MNGEIARLVSDLRGSQL